MKKIRLTLEVIERFTPAVEAAVIEKAEALALELYRFTFTPNRESPAVDELTAKALTFAEFYLAANPFFTASHENKAEAPAALHAKLVSEAAFYSERASNLYFAVPSLALERLCLAVQAFALELVTNPAAEAAPLEAALELIAEALAVRYSVAVSFT